MLEIKTLVSFLLSRLALADQFYLFYLCACRIERRGNCCCSQIFCYQFSFKISFCILFSPLDQCELEKLFIVLCLLDFSYVKWKEYLFLLMSSRIWQRLLELVAVPCLLHRKPDHRAGHTDIGLPGT